MRSISVLLLSALPAAAHQGAYLHPHDAASWMIIAAGLGTIAVAGVLGRRQLRMKR